MTSIYQEKTIKKTFYKAQIYAGGRYRLDSAKTDLKSAELQNIYLSHIHDQ